MGGIFVESVCRAHVLNDRAKAVPGNELKEYFEANYGISCGKVTKAAKLRFTPERSGWMAGETWHVQQKGSFEKDGSYVLEVPYHDDRKLVMDVLRHGSDVEVVESLAFRKAVCGTLTNSMKFYFRSGGGNGK